MAQRAPKTSTNNESSVLSEENRNLISEAVKKMMTGPDGGFQFLTQGGLREAVREMTAQFINSALQGEMDYHLAEQRKAVCPEDGTEEKPIANKRNGYSKKTVHSEMGELDVQVPRDRKGTFEPRIVPKHARRVTDFDDAIIDLYGRGMSTREIVAFVEKQYGVDVSPEFISTVTERVSEDVRQWQNRPLEDVYPVVFFDALRVNIRKDGMIKKMAVHLALGVNCEGRRDVLGMWVHENEGAAFWASVFTELQARGVKDILIAVTDGLKGMTQALEAVFPKAQHQTCIVHLIRSSTKVVSYKDRKAVMDLLKPVYKAISAEEAEKALTEFEESSIGHKYASVASAWRQAWGQVVPFFNFPPSIRKLLYTTNSIENLNRGVRKVIKTRTMFPNEEAAKKLIYLALKNIVGKWNRPVMTWSEAMPVFAGIYNDRFKAGLE